MSILQKSYTIYYYFAGDDEICFASSTYFLTGLHMYSVHSCNPSSPKHSGYLIIAILLSGRAIASLHFAGSRFHAAGVGLQRLFRMTSENVYLNYFSHLSHCFIIYFFHHTHWHLDNSFLFYY